VNTDAVGVGVGVLVMVGVIVGVADGDTLTQGALLLIHLAQSTQGPVINCMYPKPGDAGVIDVTL
jgi:hypothetical protein